MYENPQLPPVPQDTPNPYIMPANTPNPNGGNEWAQKRRKQLYGWAAANPARVSGAAMGPSNSYQSNWASTRGFGAGQLNGAATGPTRPSSGMTNRQLGGI